MKNHAGILHGFSVKWKKTLLAAKHTNGRSQWWDIDGFCLWNYLDTLASVFFCET